VRPGFGTAKTKKSLNLFRHRWSTKERKKDGKFNRERRDERIAWQGDLVARGMGSMFGELWHLKGLVRFYK
jgi:hypothetical protein